MNYNLSFISELMNQDFSNIDTLAKWCSINDKVKTILETGSEIEWINTYEELKDLVQNNPSFNVLDRLIIMNKGKDRFIQYSPQSSIGKLITHELVLSELPHEMGRFSSIEKSYFTYPYKNVIKKVIPIIDYNTEEEIGYVYIALSVDALLKNLYSYAKESDGNISVSINDEHYILKDGKIAPLTPPDNLTEQPYKPKDLDDDVSAEALRINGKRYFSISRELVYGNITIAETIQNRPFLLMRGSYAILTLITALLIILSGALLALFLNHLIMRPVNRLKKKIWAVGSSDFSRDPSIESSDELGQIGIGINNMAANIDTLLETRVEDEKKKQELEYRMLQNQINPHFLYNTLNAIKWMATLQHATGIAEMVTSLSRLMKTISKSKEQMIKLSEEIAFSKEYMTIMRFRYGSTLEYKEIIDEATLDAIIPRFTLQPLLENAIFHGIEPKGAGCVTLETKRVEGNKVKIVVSDNGEGFDTSSAINANSGGMFKSIGLENIRSRLEYAYNGCATFDIESKIGEYTKCTIVVPMEEK